MLGIVRRRQNSGLFLVALLLFAGNGGGHSAASSVAEDIDEVLSWASAGGDGYAVVVEIDDRVVLNRGYGLADRDRNRPFTPDTIAQIGSLTKQFTAAALLVLADDGKVDLQAPVGQYLPGLEGVAAKVTLHQLLTHSAGLPEYCGEDFARRTLTGLLEDCLDTELRFEPGTASAYSNAGYSLIAAVIEGVSGRTLPDYLQQRLLAPHGLDSTGYLFPDTAAPRLARGYLDGRDQGNIADRIRALGNDWWNLKGNGGMQASARDMYRWYRALSGQGLLTESVRDALTSPHSQWHEGVAEGYGWFFRDEDTGRVRQMSHAGSDGVFFSYYWHRPEERVFLYFVGNSGEDRSVTVLRDVRALLRSSLDD